LPALRPLFLGHRLGPIFASGTCQTGGDNEGTRVQKLITHRFRLDEAMKAYDTFGNAPKEKSLKVLLAAG
jgi:hypothetical protein